ncbi:MAG: hypothetical protein Q8P91_00210 [bacterium]|nr:hypothetical protein [bacterium]
MIEKIKTIEDETIKQFIATEIDYEVFEKIEEGHVGLPIFRCVDLNGNKRVIKIGVGVEGKREIDNNLYGYFNISAVGGSSFVPENINTLDTPWGLAIDLPDLGLDFTKSSNTEAKTKHNFDTLGKMFLDAVIKTKIEDKQIHIKGIVEVLSQLKSWSGLLVKNKMAKRDVVELIDSIDPISLSGNYASVMILDFTPDNIFINKGNAKFIDPWKQKEYLGTPLPSLSQFITLSENIYNIPGFNNTNLNYNSLIQKIGNEMALDTKTVNAQLNIGRALQYSLSSYVRITSNPKISELYANISRKNIEEIIN